MLEDKIFNINFVILAACHSENCGKAFQIAGIKHVICIKREEKLNDRAAVVFSRQFYQSYFRENLLFCSAY